MMRELPERYAEYRLLGVSEAVERVWRREAIAAEAAKLAEDGDPRDYWSLFSRVEALVSAQREPEPLARLHERAAAISGRIRDDDALAFAETILGRGHREARTGLVYLAFDLGRKDLAAAFAELALALCARAKSPGEARAREALTLCTSLQTELGL